MKRTSLFALLIAGMLLLPVLASAQNASGTLTISATVQSSISMAFNSDASGVALSAGGGTNAATLAFGNISAFGAVGANITRSVVPGTSFTVSTPFDIMVVKTNSSSANFTLTGQLGSADAVNSWSVGGVAVASGSASTITATGSYAAAGNSLSLALQVPFTATSGAINNTINFVATAN